MELKEYNEKETAIEDNYEKQKEDLKKEFNKGFEKKYFKNSENLIALVEKGNNDDFLVYQFDIKEKYPTLSSVDFYRSWYKTREIFTEEFGKEYGGDTPVEITGEEFVKGVVDRFNMILDS